MKKSNLLIAGAGGLLLLYWLSRSESFRSLVGEVTGAGGESPYPEEDYSSWYDRNKVILDPALGGTMEGSGAGYPVPYETPVPVEVPETYYEFYQPALRKTGEPGEPGGGLTKPTEKSGGGIGIWDTILGGLTAIELFRFLRGRKGKGGGRPTPTPATEPKPIELPEPTPTPTPSEIPTPIKLGGAAGIAAGITTLGSKIWQGLTNVKLPTAGIPASPIILPSPMPMVKAAEKFFGKISPMPAASAAQASPTTTRRILSGGSGSSGGSRSRSRRSEPSPTTTRRILSGV